LQNQKSYFYAKALKSILKLLPAVGVILTAYHMFVDATLNTNHWQENTLQFSTPKTLCPFIPYIIMTRNERLINLRPEIKFDISKTSLDAETFQNQTLRPILKWQHEIIIRLLNNHFSERTMPIDKKEQVVFITKYLIKNLVLKQQLIGICIGLFTDNEMEYYLDNQKTINSRLNQLVLKKALDYYML
jgi:NAD-specific glutamate dehydrogenase